MMKDAIVTTYFQRVNELTIENKKYQHFVDVLIRWLLETDAVETDLTTNALRIDKDHNSDASIVSRKAVTIAGIEEIIYLLKTYTSLRYEIHHMDGERIDPGQSLLEIKGSTAEILAYERVLLNILQRLSGIASATNTLVSRLESIKEKPFIAATRKTNWGFLDKKAVAMGGGLTHRLSLADGVLIKDNHLQLLRSIYRIDGESRLVKKALELLLVNLQSTLIEIEVEEASSIEALLNAFSSVRTNNVLGILLDNFSPITAKSVLRKVKQKHDISSIIFEASGGITEENLVDWAQTGVDIISLGALTHSSKAADISLDLQ